jgi:hypothetical protein
MGRMRSAVGATGEGDEEGKPAEQGEGMMPLEQRVR